MANITLRQSSGNTEPRLSSANVKGSILTSVEVDNNFNNLNNDIDSRLSKSGGTITGDLTVSGNVSTIKTITSEQYNDSLSFDGKSYTSLHRSPNVITAMYIYDTRNDSDGGAWTEKCQHTSWYNEELCGKWLGIHGSEIEARYSSPILGNTVTQTWIPQTNWTIYENGNLEANNATATISCTPSPTSGVIYNIRFTVNITSGSVAFGLGGSTPTITAYTSGTYVVSLQKTGTVGGNRFMATNFTGIISDFSIREVVGQTTTTGDYFQLTTDGKFYKLNAGSGITEVFRGNKRSFPKVAGIVSDYYNVTIYDLTETGRPMWMRFAGVSTLTVSEKSLFSVANYTSATITVAVNGKLVIGSDGGGLTIVDFAVDKATLRTNTSGHTWNGTIATRNSVGGYATTDTSISAIAGIQILAVDASIFPDAPTDPVTGLKIPTIAFAMNARVGILQNSGAYIHSSLTNSFYSVTLTPKFLAASRTDNSIWYYALNPGTLGALFTLSTDTNTTAPDFNDGNTTVLKAKDRSTLSRCSGVVVQILHTNETAFGKGIAAKLSNTFNAGFLLGDIRRCYLSNTITGNITGVISNLSYKSATANVIGILTANTVASNTSLVAYSGFSSNNYIQEPYSSDLDFGTGEWNMSAWVNVPVNSSSNGTIISCSYSSGPYITLGLNSANNIYSTAYDGVTTRTVTTTSTYNTATWTKVESNYRSGRLSLVVNGTEVTNTTGAPLLSANNANAVFTIGNSYSLDSPFPGSIALVKASATVPTAEQSTFMYEQEKQLFANNAQCVLPSTTNVLDLAYDYKTDTWIASQAGFESTWSGLIRTANTPVPAGSFSKTTAASGIRLSARTTTNPGVDISFANTNLSAETSEINTINKEIVRYTYTTIGFSANTANGNTILTSVSVTTGTPYIGMKITGTGIPTDTTITGINGSIYYISNAATANNTGIVMGQADFDLPVGYTAVAVYHSGNLKREGSTKDYTRLYDGFKETIRFGTSPGNATVVTIQAIKE